MSNATIRASLPVTWQTSLELDVEDVWNAFYIYSLLLDYQARGEVMQLSNNAHSQSERLRPALHERNARMAGTDGVEYATRSTVTDGIAMGRPSCAVHDCMEPLPNVNQRHCILHSHLDRHNPEHRSFESYYYLQGKAMFQLKHRLDRIKVSQTNDSMSSGQRSSALYSRPRMNDEVNGELLPESSDGLMDNDDGSAGEGPGVDADEDVEIDADGICDGKPETGNRSTRARFGRRRTHNEQLCVGSCGVILGRATFYGSEAPNGVRKFWMTLFPTQASLPRVLWHDNNCRMVAMLKNDPEEHLRTYFDSCALPVDVFHFKCKHKEGDLECGRNCNPYIWPELRTKDGKWRFNSSAAEQTNAWFGGFQSMVREMQADRYDFFLDEMILRRNKSMIQDLKARGCAPYSIPRSELLKPDEPISSSN
ncbi:hypothetical protein C8R43DRAFT_1138631 [Mycena crocata]|nr:hypothetical protein C8R43DRAFT_1138631 [Mycena crocata]